MQKKYLRHIPQNLACTMVVGFIFVNLCCPGQSISQEKPEQYKKLSKGEIDILQESGEYSHGDDLKPNSKYDFYKTRRGEVIVKPKNGGGPGETTGLNINDIRNRRQTIERLSQQREQKMQEGIKSNSRESGYQQLRNVNTQLQKTITNQTNYRPGVIWRQTARIPPKRHKKV